MNSSVRHSFATLCLWNPNIPMKHSPAKDGQYSETVRIGLPKVITLFLTFEKNYVATTLKEVKKALIDHK